MNQLPSDILEHPGKYSPEAVSDAVLQRVAPSGAPERRLFRLRPAVVPAAGSIGGSGESFAAAAALATARELRAGDAGVDDLRKRFTYHFDNYAFAHFRALDGQISAGLDRYFSCFAPRLTHDTEVTRLLPRPEDRLEAFGRAYEKFREKTLAPDFPGFETAAQAFLRVIYRGIAKNHAKTSGKGQPTGIEDLGPMIPDALKTFVTPASELLARRLLSALIDQAPKCYIITVMARHDNGYQYRHLIGIFGPTLDAVKKYGARCRKQLGEITRSTINTRP